MRPLAPRCDVVGHGHADQLQYGPGRHACRPRRPADFRTPRPPARAGSQPGPADQGAGPAAGFAAGCATAAGWAAVTPEDVVNVALTGLAGIPDPDLRARLTPGYVLGCKRVLLSNDYYPALTQPDTELVAAGLAKVDGARSPRRTAPPGTLT